MNNIHRDFNIDVRWSTVGTFVTPKLDIKSIELFTGDVVEFRIKADATGEPIETTNPLFSGFSISKNKNGED